MMFFIKQLNIDKFHDDIPLLSQFTKAFILED